MNDLEFSIHVLSQGFMTWHRIANKGLVKLSDRSKLNDPKRDTVYPQTFRLMHKGSLCTLSRCVGSGRYSVVYARDQFAFKRVHTSCDATLRLACKDLLYMHSLRSPFVMRALASQIVMEHGQIVKIIHQMPLAQGTLADCQSASLGPTAFATRWQWLQDVAMGLLYLHQSGVVHGDVKAANILRMAGGRACITDLGLSTFAEKTAFDTPLASLHWAPPEALSGLGYSCASDVWSFGLLCLNTFLGTTLLKEVASTEEMLKHWSARLPDIANQVWSVTMTEQERAMLQRVIAACLCWKPSDRCTMSEACTLMGLAPLPKPAPMLTCDFAPKMSRALTRRAATFDPQHLSKICRDFDQFLWRAQLSGDDAHSAVFHVLTLCEFAF